MRRLIVGLLLAALPAAAWANGRPPQAIGLHFRPGNDNDIVLAATFGGLFSHDNGVTWSWVCESAIGYGGTFDPDYAVTPTGTVIATTFSGVQIDRDAGCTFALSSFGESYARNITATANGRIYVAMAYAGDATAIPPVPPDYKIYTSTDDAVSFDAGTTVGTSGESWTSIEAAASDPQRVYLTGYRLDGNSDKVHLLFRSDDGAQSFTPLAVTEFAVTDRSVLEIAAISPTDPDRVLLRVTWWNPAGVIGDAFYLTTNAGQAWTKVLETNDNARGVVLRANGDAIVATFRTGIHRSTDGGQVFSLVPGTVPEVYCLDERPNGELWACTDNYALPPFDHAVMKTTDLATWTGVMNFQRDIVGPVICPAGTVQQDCCTVNVDACQVAAPPTWCLLQSQLAIEAMPIDCSPPQPDAPGEMPKGTCCGAGAEPAGVGLMTLAVGLTLRRRRRRVA